MAARGFRVFPLVPGEHRPAVADWQKLATTDEAMIRRVWGARDYNVGVPAGDGLLIVDADMKNGKNGIASAQALGVALTGLVVQSPSGGAHVYLNGPDVSNAVGLGDGLDIRSKGGYVVGPGSVLREGAKPGTPAGVYTLLHDGDPAPAPAALIQRLVTPLEKRADTTPRVEADRPDAIARAVGFLVGPADVAIEGNAGDLTTFKVAATLKDYGVSENTAVALMAEHWNVRCSPPWDLDDLKTKVANAYEYGARPLGDVHPFADMAGIKPILPTTETRAPSAWFRHGDEFNADENWLFYGILPAQGVGVTVAPPGAGKTFALLELARCLATGKPFFRVEPDERGGTLLVFAGTEGSGLAQRLAALGEDAPLPISATVVGNLADRDALTNLLADLQAEARRILAEFGVPVRLIVLETMASTGLLSDENDNAEAGRVMANLAQIGRAMGCFVMTSHHPSKDGAASRGASAIPGAADYLLTIHRQGLSGVRDLELTKARNAEQRQLGSFTLLPVVLGEDKRGRPITSMTLSTGDVGSSNTLRVAPHVDKLLEALTYLTGGDDVELVNGKPAASEADLRDEFKDRKGGSTDRSNVNKTFKAALGYLEQIGRVQIVPHNGGRFVISKEAISG